MLALLVGGALGTAPAHAASEDYVLDPVHTRVMFAVEHAGFSKAIGTLSGSTGSLSFDPEDWSTARVDVSIPLRQTELGDAKWNRATLGGSLLDAQRFPDARFVSTRVEPVDEKRARVVGDLTLRGVTREITLDVVFNVVKRHPLPPFRRTAGFSATTAIKRSDFGISAWKSMIGDEVELRMEVEAVRGQADPAPAAEPAPADAQADEAADAADAALAQPDAEPALEPAP